MEPYTPFLLVSLYSCPASVLKNTFCPSGDITRVKTQKLIVRNIFQEPYKIKSRPKKIPGMKLMLLGLSFCNSGRICNTFLRFVKQLH